MIRGASGGDLGWFLEARFGMFIHFWAVLAGGPARVGEEPRTPDRQRLQRYIAHFDPDLYDPVAWARLAKAAGCRYVVITTKHHDGFCLWDSDLTDYKSTNTPHGKDLIGPLVNAVRAEGLRIGFYHSLLDWHHPEFPVDFHHPQRDNEAFKAATASRDVAKYAAYLHGQVRELLTRFGRIDYLFFDFSYAGRHGVWGGKGAAEWRSKELLAMVRELQPDIVVNDRLDIPGDITTPEQYQPSGPRPVPWEACQTLNGSWGYDRDNLDFKSPDLLVRMLVDGVAKGGNLLLNVGPTGRGLVDPRSQQIMSSIGEWMRLHDRAVYGCGPSEFVAPPDSRYTQRGDRLYLHLFAWPLRHVHLAGLAGRVAYAQLLHDASEVRTFAIDPGQVADTITMSGPPAGTLTIELPVQRPDVAVPVVELFLVPGS